MIIYKLKLVMGYYMYLINVRNSTKLQGSNHVFGIEVCGLIQDTNEDAWDSSNRTRWRLQMQPRVEDQANLSQADPYPPTRGLSVHL
ncbi:hypothetical protein V8C42DRAFT_324779 [Trichoderma barbatum]